MRQSGLKKQILGALRVTLIGSQTGTRVQAFLIFRMLLSVFWILLLFSSHATAQGDLFRKPPKIELEDDRDRDRSKEPYKTKEPYRTKDPYGTKKPYGTEKPSGVGTSQGAEGDKGRDRPKESYKTKDPYRTKESYKTKDPSGVGTSQTPAGDREPYKPKEPFFERPSGGDPSVAGGRQTDVPGHRELPQAIPGQDSLPDVLRQPRRAPHRNTTLVLSGGGSKGAFQVGVLKYLYEVRGFRPDIITGTSVGALNAAKLAEGQGSGANSRAALDGLLELWRSIDGDDSIYVEHPDFRRLLNAPDDLKDWALTTALTSLSHPLLGQAYGVATAPNLSRIERRARELESVASQRPLIDLVQANLNRSAVANSGIKLRIAAVTRDSGELRYFTQGGDVVTPDDVPIHRGERSIFLPPSPPPLGAPRSPGAPSSVLGGVIASSTIPIVFEPIEIAGEYYWDAAIREDVPIRKALQMGATDLTIIVSAPRKYAPGALATVPVDINIVHRIMHAMEIMADEVFQNDISGVLDVLDVLHDLGQDVAPKVKLFPLPRDPLTNKPFMIPYYIVIEPPFRLGDTTSFEPVIIQANIELGEIVARHAVVDPPDERQKRVDIIEFLERKIAHFQQLKEEYRERIRSLRERHPGLRGVSAPEIVARADYWKERFQRVLTDYRNSQTVPLRARREPH